MRPHDHLGCAIGGAAEFPVLAAPFLAEGAALGEFLMYVAEDPDPADVSRLHDLLDPDTLLVMSTAEVYGSTGVVDPARQLGTYAGVLAEALAAGFTGIRVAADCAPLISDEERLRAWTRWEVVADRFIAENQVTALCAFDRERADVGRLRHLATLHPLSSASSPVPRFRLFSDAGALRIEGELDSVAVTQLRLALDNLPPGTGVVIDLDSATVPSSGVIADLAQLGRSGVGVTIRGDQAAIGELTRPAGVLADPVRFEEA
jgi:hypothetical protein